MAYLVKTVKSFDKGIVDSIGDQVIPNGANSRSINFLDVGDKLELVRGQLLMGVDLAATGRSCGVWSASDISGNEYLYRVRDTNLERYIPATNTWSIIKSDLSDDKDTSFANYRTPAGSFMFICSQYDGPLRINLANPDTVSNLYDAAKNYRGFIAIQDNRMFLWQRIGYETTLYLSWIDDDWPYTAVTNETLGTGNGTVRTFSGTLAHPYVAALTLTISDGVEAFTETGTGILTGAAGGTGTINYSTGAYSVTFAVAPLNAVAVRATAYRYELPNTNGVTDFTYSATRVAGEGDYFFQAQNNDKIQNVFPYDSKFYIPHEKSIWELDLGTDDTQASNKIYRENTGIPNWRAACATGDGIYYIDDSDNDSKVARILKYDDLSTKVLPKPVSDQIDLTTLVFDDSACIEFGDFIIWACKSSSAATNNDTLLLYNRKWELWDKADGLFRSFCKYQNKLYGGSSVTGNVYELLSGYDDDQSPILGVWEANDWDLETDELKKCKKFVVEGDMAESQTLIVEVSFDEQNWIQVGTIAGNSEYVQRVSGTTYGSIMYGAETYGADIPVIAYRYMREFKLGSTKFYRVKIRFRTETFGYLNVKQYMFKDIRLKGHKVPSMFR